LVKIRCAPLSEMVTQSQKATDSLGLFDSGIDNFVSN